MQRYGGIQSILLREHTVFFSGGLGSLGVLGRPTSHKKCTKYSLLLIKGVVNDRTRDAVFAWRRVVTPT